MSLQLAFAGIFRHTNIHLVPIETIETISSLNIQDSGIGKWFSTFSVEIIIQGREFFNLISSLCKFENQTIVTSRASTTTLDVRD